VVFGHQLYPFAMNSRFACCLLIALGVNVGCEKFEDPGVNYTYRKPEDIGDGLSVSGLQQEGLDQVLISAMTDRVIRDEYKRVDGVLILRNGRLVYEEYFHGYSKDISHNIYSAGKSITSILMGIAIDRGFIADVDVRVADLLPEYKDIQNPDSRKNAITIRHLLNMSSGLDCDDLYLFTESQMQRSSDWVKFTLDLPMRYDPGTQGLYCTGGVVVLGRIIENASGMSLEDFANRFLFGPLNITRYQWHIMPDGHPSGGGLLFLSPRDMAKLGQLMLDGGVWNNELIVSRQWVETSSQIQLKLSGPFDGYGYLWWKQAFNGVETWFADGNGGQQILIIPEKNAVIVFTGGNKNTATGLQNFDIVNRYVLPSML